MKFNADCIRDILLCVEAKTDADTSLIIEDGNREGDMLSEYPFDVVAYHLELCEDSGYLVGFARFMDGSFRIDRLSSAGHAFLDNIRSDTVWKKTKDRALKLGVLSCEALFKAAGSVFAEAFIKNLM